MSIFYAWHKNCHADDKYLEVILSMKKSWLRSCSNSKTVQQYICRKISNSGYMNAIHQADTSNETQSLNHKNTSIDVQNQGLHFLHLSFPSITPFRQSFACSSTFSNPELKGQQSVLKAGICALCSCSSAKMGPSSLRTRQMETADSRRVSPIPRWRWVDFTAQARMTPVKRPDVELLLCLWRRARMPFALGAPDERAFVRAVRRTRAPTIWSWSLVMIISSSRGNESRREWEWEWECWDLDPPAAPLLLLRCCCCCW